MSANASRSRAEAQGMSDQARDRAIIRAGRQVEYWMARYENTSNLEDRANAAACCKLMAALIRDRSAAQVRSMELARGLA